jgi:hypothetical protein
MDLIPYEKWSSEPHARWLLAGNAFGAHLMYAREKALEEIPSDATADQRIAIEKAVDTAICGVMALFDTYLPTDLGENYSAIYAVITRICRKGDLNKTIEEIELAPDGDGLQMGFWGWIKGDFGAHSEASGKK